MVVEEVEEVPLLQGTENPSGSNHHTKEHLLERCYRIVGIALQLVVLLVLALGWVQVQMTTSPDSVEFVAKACSVKQTAYSQGKVHE